MASIIKRTRADGTETFLVQIRINGAKSLSKTFLSLHEAERFSLHEEAKIRRAAETFHAPDPTRFYKENFRDVLDLYAAEPGLAKRTRDILRVIRKAIPAHTRMGELRPRWVEDFIEKRLSTKTMRGKNYTPATVATHINVMRQAYIWRARRYDIEPQSVPFTTSYLPRGWDEGRDRRLAPHEEQLLLNAMSAHEHAEQWKCLFAMALETAARLQELVLATWSEFNLEKRYWIIPKEHEKTRTSRPVPLSSTALTALQEMQRLSPKGPNDRVFEFATNPNSTSKAFGRIRTKAGLDDFHFHDLRHEGISRWVLYKRQYSLMEIMKIVGHSSPVMVARYANLRADELAAKMD